MAASGTITGVAYKNSAVTSNYSFWATWVRNSQDTEKNTSNITVTLRIKCTAWSNGAYNLDRKPDVSLTVGGISRTPTISVIDTRNYKECVFATWTGDVDHKDDGTLNCQIIASFTHYGSNSLTSGTVSGNAPQETIPRASDITSAAAVTLGNKCSVKWTPMAEAFRYKLKFTMGGWSHTTGAIHPNTTAAYTYTGYIIPLEVAKQLPEARTGTMSVTLYTYSDSGATKQVSSTDTKTFTITVPDNANTKPVVSMVLSPESALPDAFAGLYIQGMTKVKATITSEGKYDAVIDSHFMKVDGTFYYEDLISGYLGIVGSRNVYGYAEDKRGHIGENIQQIQVLAYQGPKLENASAIRCDADGNASGSGTYLKISAKRTYSPVVSEGVQKNFCKIMYRYSDGLAYTDWETILDSTTLGTDTVTTGPLLGGLSTQASYTVHLRAVDNVGRYAETYITIPTDDVYWHRDGARNALGLGKYNERYDAIDSAWDFYMNGHKVTGLPAPENGSDAVPMSYAAPADIQMQKSLNAQGWYKLGTVTGEMCGVVTLTIGGVFVNNQASPSMVDIATQHNNARAFLRMPSLADNQISKIGVSKESTLVYGVYAYYNSANTNTVKVNVHTHMGEFTKANWDASSVSESDMLAVINVKE